MEYHHGWGIRIISLFGAVLFGFIGSLGVDKEPYASAALWGFSLFSLWMAIESWAYLAISKSGLRYVHPL